MAWKQPKKVEAFFEVVLEESGEEKKRLYEKLFAEWKELKEKGTKDFGPYWTKVKEQVGEADKLLMSKYLSLLGVEIPEELLSSESSSSSSSNEGEIEEIMAWKQPKKVEAFFEVVLEESGEEKKRLYEKLFAEWKKLKEKGTKDFGPYWTKVKELVGEADKLLMSKYLCLLGVEIPEELLSSESSSSSSNEGEIEVIQID